VGRGWFAAGGGGVTPIGRIWATAGVAAMLAIAAIPSKELERRFIGLVNMFISNDNPASRNFITTVAGRPPAASATEPVDLPLNPIFLQTNP
jgi:hypothetical protein